MARLGNEAKRLNGLNVLNMRLASFHPAVSRRDQDEFLRQNHQAVKRHETDTLRGPSSSRSSIEITPLVLNRWIFCEFSSLHEDSALTPILLGSAPFTPFTGGVIVRVGGFLRGTHFSRHISQVHSDARPGGRAAAHGVD